MRTVFVLSGLLASLCAAGTGTLNADEPRQLNVFLLAGQSNMAGADSVAALSPEVQVTDADRAARFSTAPLPDGARSTVWLPWSVLQPHRVKETLVHGPELGFARTLHQHGWRNVAMIKVYANFGRDADKWPWGEGGYLFRAWMEFVDGRLEELRQQGYQVEVRGFVWHQGIDDAIHGRFAAEYGKNVAALIAVLRKRFNAQDAPFVLARSVNSRIAQPTPDPNETSPMSAVRRAQVQLAVDVPRVAWINVDDQPNVNTHHFTAAGQLVLGQRFADAFLTQERASVNLPR
jgi:hypothetical protein